MTIVMGCYHSNVPDPNMMYGSEMPNIKPYAIKTKNAQRSSKRNLVHPGTEPNGIIQALNNWTTNPASTPTPTPTLGAKPPPGSGVHSRRNSGVNSAALSRESSPQLRALTRLDANRDSTHSNRGSTRDISSVSRMNGEINQENNGGSLKRHVRIELRGDIHSCQEARRRREVRLKSAHKRREEMAAEMSDRIMDEKERLSFTSSAWSRTGSRVTSRAASPHSSAAHPRT